MKTKKLYNALLCYLLLAALTGVICIGISSGSAVQHQKIVVSTDQTSLNAALNFLFEEQNDTEQVIQSQFLLQPWFSHSALVPLVMLSFILCFTLFKQKVSLIKTPLFITLRVLRL